MPLAKSLARPLCRTLKRSQVGAGAGIDNILLEDGSNLLLEDGSVLLTE